MKIAMMTMMTMMMTMTAVTLLKITMVIVFTEVKVPPYTTLGHPPPPPFFRLALNAFSDIGSVGRIGKKKLV